MQESDIIVRIVSDAGRNRITIDPKSTCEELKEKISAKIGVPLHRISLYQDQGHKKLYKGTDSSSLKRAGITNGAQVFVPAKNAKMVEIIEKQRQEKEKAEEDKEEEKIDTSASSKIDKTPVEEPEPTPAPKKLRRPNEMDISWFDEAKVIKDAKHEPFEYFISEKKKQNRLWIPMKDISYKMRRDWTNHKPYPAGMCNRWIPPSCILNRQKYRHVDYVSILNSQELQSFVNTWLQGNCMEQRVSWLYGYYSEDPNYPDGVRANVEALHDPPQYGDMEGFHILQDEKEVYVDMVATSLGLEKIGWVYTSLNHEPFLTPKEIRDIAKMQEKFAVDHPEGIRVPKFVTVVVKPKGDTGESGIDCWMVSDQCQALERDDMIRISEDNKKLIAREAEENEMVPNILQSGSSVKEFDPEFFIVSVSNGQPLDAKDYTYMKNYDFPAANRGMVPNHSDLKNYINAHKSDSSAEKFANFQFLVHIIEKLDLETVCAVADKIAKGEEIEDFIVELIEGLAN